MLVNALVAALHISAAALPLVSAPGVQCPQGTIFDARKANGQSVQACDFVNESDGMLRGVAADNTVVVVPQPIRPNPLSPYGVDPPRVNVYGKALGNLLGELPLPPGGFATPFGAKFNGNKLMVIDIGPFSNDPSAQFGGFIAEYTKSGIANFSLNRVISFAGLGAGFIADCEPVGDEYVCADQIAGALWVVSAGGNVSMGLGAPGAPPGFGILELQLGVNPPGVAWDFARYPDKTPLAFTPVPPNFPFPPGSTFVPGANYLAYHAGTDTVVWFSVAAQAFYAIPYAVLKNSESLSARATNIYQVASVASMPFAPGTTDFKAIIGAMSFKRASPSNPWLYIPDPMRARVLRLNILTGEWVEVIANVHLFDSPSNLQFFGTSELWVCSDQEEGLGFLNSALTPPPGWPPFIPYTDFRGEWKVARIWLDNE